MKKNNKGFTLVELIIVIAIVAILAVVLAPQYLKYVEQSRASTDMDTAAAIENAVNVLIADGTITEAVTVTWTLDATGTIDTTVDAYDTALKAVLNEADMKVPARSQAALKETDNFTVTVTFAIDGTPSVVVAPDYRQWDPKAPATDAE